MSKKIILTTAIIFAIILTAVVIITATDNKDNEKPKQTQLPIVVLEPSPTATPAEAPTVSEEKPVIVLDAGHGKDSALMTDEEKENSGYTYNSEKGSRGEWRHFKNGTCTECGGSDCIKTGPDCWYAMGNGDREIEPEINLGNALFAKQYLEEMGYTVRMTRSTNDENPSMTKRVSYCYPDNDMSKNPDASLYVCIHSNAGGGSGTSYISLDGTYTQKHIPTDFVDKSNTVGEVVNRAVAENCDLAEREPIGGEGYLILFNKVPVPIAYLEIGFYDNPDDLDILRSQSERIGKGIAEGIDEYLR